MHTLWNIQVLEAVLSKISIYQLIFKTEEAGVEGEGDPSSPFRGC